tara:strand:+ start:842 stop:1012 length:171 start_codon:yes stop_codon:yes gene_type:complete
MLFDDIFGELVTHQAMPLASSQNFWISVVLLVHLIIGGLMLGGKISVPGAAEEASE